MASIRKSSQHETGFSMKHMAKSSISILLAFSLASPGAALTGRQGLTQGSLTPVKAAAEESSTDGTANEENQTILTYTTYTQYYEDGTQEKKATITGFTGAGGNLTIPKTLTVEGEVISVGKITAFNQEAKAKLTGLTIEDGAEIEIAEKAFQECPNLKTVSLPSGTTFGVETATSSTIIHYGYNFADCASLTELTLGDGMTVLPEHIFENCTSLKSVRLPSKLDCFENNAFTGCTSLENLEIPEGVQEIAREGFSGCTSLTKVSIPSSVERWCISQHLKYSNHAQNQNGAFSNCTSLAEVTFAEGLTVIGQESFDGTALTSVTVPSTVKALDFTFYDCETLEEVILQEGDLERIGRNAFANCKLLKSVEIPPTVTTLGESPFLNCESLKLLILPPSVKIFEGNVYFDKGCTSLEQVFILAEEIELTNVAYSSCSNIYCPAGSATYERYSQSNLRPIALTPDLLTTDLLGVTAETYQGVYDGKAHPLATMAGLKETDQISCRILENGTETGEALAGIPEISEPGTYDMKFSITRMGVEYTMTKTLQAKITKLTPVLQLADTTVKEGENWTVAPKEYDGDGNITYSYYEDEQLEKKCSSKPAAPGVYYVQATAAEGMHYESAESNVAKLEILESDNPPATAEPTTQPTVTVKKAKIKKVKSPSKKTMQVRWNKVTNATGYVIWIGRNKKFTKGKKTYTVKSGKTTKKIIRKLKRKKKYFVKVRAYRVVKGKKYPGAFSSVKSIKIK